MGFDKANVTHSITVNDTVITSVTVQEATIFWVLVYTSLSFRNHTTRLPQKARDRDVMPRLSKRLSTEAKLLLFKTCS